MSYPMTLPPTTYRLTKMHGLGNDFVMMDVMDAAPALQEDLRGEQTMSALARLMCDRHLGLGADGLILVSRLAEKPVPYFLYYNMDGTPGGMCGNGIRCFGLYVRDRGYVTQDAFACPSPVGDRHLTVDLTSQQVTVNMGLPILNPTDIPCNTQHPNVQPAGALGAYQVKLAEGSAPLQFWPVSMGNPHAIFWDDDQPTPLLPSTYGPQLETHPAFPQKTNVEFAQKLSNKHVMLTVWERGCGLTQACGTGACATVVAGRLSGRLDPEVTVTLPGGDLRIRWEGNPTTDPVWMTGPATFVYEALPSPALAESVSASLSPRCVSTSA